VDILLFMIFRTQKHEREGERELSGVMDKEIKGLKIWRKKCEYL